MRAHCKGRSVELKSFFRQPIWACLKIGGFFTTMVNSLDIARYNQPHWVSPGKNDHPFRLRTETALRLVLARSKLRTTSVGCKWMSQTPFTSLPSAIFVVVIRLFGVGVSSWFPLKASHLF